VTTSGGCWSPSPNTRPPTRCAARRQKWGGGRVRTESDLTASGSNHQPAGLNATAGTEPTPEFAEEYRRLFEALRNEELRRGKKRCQYVEKIDFGSYVRRPGSKF
jgi:hypothetical protein